MEADRKSHSCLVMSLVAKLYQEGKLMIPVLSRQTLVGNMQPMYVRALLKFACSQLVSCAPVRVPRSSSDAMDESEPNLYPLEQVIVS